MALISKDEIFSQPITIRDSDRIRTEIIALCVKDRLDPSINAPSLFEDYERALWEEHLLLKRGDYGDSGWDRASYERQRSFWIENLARADTHWNGKEYARCSNKLTIVIWKMRHFFQRIPWRIRADYKYFFRQRKPN